jgi:hypothetical protein
MPGRSPAVELDPDDIRLIVYAAVAFVAGLKAKPQDAKAAADLWEACVRVGAAVNLKVDPLGSALDPSA